MLESMGWEAIPVRSGTEALKLVEQDAPRLVITDMIMPDMEGTEIVRRMRKVNPDVPLIVMSGNPVGTRFLKSAEIFGAGATLAKPFSRGELENAIKQVTARS